MSDPDREWFRYRSTEGDRFARPLFWRGSQGFEPETMPMFLRYAGEGGLVVDVGANVGVYSLFALSLDPSIEVLAFEPVDRVRILFERNLDLNDWHSRARVRPEAVSEAVGVAEFIEPHIAVPSSARLGSAKYRVTSKSFDVVTVPTVTLDTATDVNTRVSTLKIDVEGAEDAVLRGASRILRRDRPAVFFEYHPEGPGAEIEAILRDHSYRLYRISEDGPVAVKSLSGSTDRRARNYLATPAEWGNPEAPATTPSKPPKTPRR